MKVDIKFVALLLMLCLVIDTIPMHGLVVEAAVVEVQAVLAGNAKFLSYTN